MHQMAMLSIRSPLKLPLNSVANAADYCPPFHLSDSTANHHTVTEFRRVYNMYGIRKSAHPALTIALIKGIQPICQEKTVKQPYRITVQVW